MPQNSPKVHNPMTLINVDSCAAMATRETPLFYGGRAQSEHRRFTVLVAKTASCQPNPVWPPIPRSWRAAVRTTRLASLVPGVVPCLVFPNGMRTEMMCHC